MAASKASLEDRLADCEEVRLSLIQQSAREEEHKSDIDRLQQELSRLSLTEEGLLSKLSGRDGKISQLEERLAELLQEGGGGGGRGRHRDSVSGRQLSLVERFCGECLQSFYSKLEDATCTCKFRLHTTFE